MSSRYLFSLSGLGALAILLCECSSTSTPTTTASGGSGGTVAHGGGGATATGGGGAFATGGTSVIASGGGGFTSFAGTSSVGGGGASSGGGGATSGGSAGVGGSAGGSGAAGSSGTTSGGASGAGGGNSGSFTLTSPDQAEGAKFAGTFTCNGGTIGQGINPELDWAGAPSGTMSFAITFIDTSIGANMQMGQHWAMWNIPATVAKLPQGTKTLTGDFANAKQSGAFLAPCAIMDKVAGMDDLYEFTVYALSTTTLNVTGTSVANALTALGVLPNDMLIASVLGKATLHGHAGAKGQ